MSQEILYAVVRVGGKQYKVAVGDSLVVDRLAVEPGHSVSLEPVAVRTADGSFDPAAAKRTKVKARVEEHLLGEKVRVFTYKPKTTYKRMRGHRSKLSRLTVENITL